MIYKAIGFDYGGVINGIPVSNFDSKLCQVLNIDENKYKESYFSHYGKFRTELSFTERDLWTLVLTDLDRLQSLDEVLSLADETKRKVSINKEVLGLIKNLREKGYKTGLLSNNSQAAADNMRLNGIDKLFDAFIISAEADLSKPNPKAYKLLADQLNVDLSELVFIDDEPRNLETSNECGFKPILFSSYLQCTKELDKLGVQLQ